VSRCGKDGVDLLRRRPRISGERGPEFHSTRLDPSQLPEPERIMQKLVRVGVSSFAKHLAILDGVLGLVGSLILIFFAFVEAISGDMSAAVGSAVMALIAPFLYAALGFVMGALIAWVYNLIAAKLGGIELELR
jgi:hypothetical protein